MYGGQLKWKFARALKLTVQPIEEAVGEAGLGTGGRQLSRPVSCHRLDFILCADNFSL